MTDHRQFQSTPDRSQQVPRRWLYEQLPDLGHHQGMELESTRQTDSESEVSTAEQRSSSSTPTIACSSSSGVFNLDIIFENSVTHSMDDIATVFEQENAADHQSSLKTLIIP